MTTPPASALLLLQASERLISAWDHPTMDGGALAKAKREFREAFAAAATEHRLAAQNAPSRVNDG